MKTTAVEISWDEKIESLSLMMKDLSTFMWTVVALIQISQFQHLDMAFILGPKIDGNYVIFSVLFKQLCFKQISGFFLYLFEVHRLDRRDIISYFFYII